MKKLLIIAILMLSATLFTSTSPQKEITLKIDPRALELANHMNSEIEKKCLPTYLNMRAKSPKSDSAFSVFEKCVNAYKVPRDLTDDAKEAAHTMLPEIKKQIISVQKKDAEAVTDLSVETLKEFYGLIAELHHSFNTAEDNHHKDIDTLNTETTKKTKALQEKLTQAFIAIQKQFAPRKEALQKKMAEEKAAIAAKASAKK